MRAFLASTLAVVLLACGPGGEGSGSGSGPPPPPPQYASPAAVYGTARAAIQAGEMAAFLRCWTPAMQRKLAMTVASGPAMIVRDARETGEVVPIAEELAVICRDYRVILPDEVWGLGDVDRVSGPALALADVPGFFAALVELLGKQPGGQSPKALFQQSYVGALGKVQIYEDEPTYATAPLTTASGKRLLHFRQLHDGSWRLSLK